MSCHEAPEVGSIQWAETATATAQHVQILVTAVDAETDAGWHVYGYRRYPTRRNGRRQTMIPRAYFVARAIGEGDDR